MGERSRSRILVYLLIYCAGQHYHPECFICFKCQTQLGPDKIPTKRCDPPRPRRPSQDPDSFFLCFWCALCCCCATQVRPPVLSQLCTQLRRGRPLALSVPTRPYSLITFSFLLFLIRNITLLLTRAHLDVWCACIIMPVCPTVDNSAKASSASLRRPSRVVVPLPEGEGVSTIDQAALGAEHRADSKNVFVDNHVMDQSSAAIG